MSKTNFGICHEFFYSGFNQEYMPRYLNVGFRDNKFYSYNTVIGAVVKNKKGGLVLLISSDNISNTTAKHLSALWSASPYEKIFIPFEYGWDCFGEFKAEYAAELFERALNQLSKAKMSLAKNRDEFIRCFNNATVFSDSVYTLKFLKKFEKTYIQVTEHVDEIKAGQRKLDAIKLKKAKNKLNKLLKTQSIEEINEYQYIYNDPVLFALIGRNKTRALKKECATAVKESVSCFGYAKTLKNIENDKYKLEAFRKAFCYENDFAFAWLSDDGTFKTTKYITLDKNVGIVALRLWKHKKLHLGAHVGIYTVLKITDEYVKIGCHTIPTKNLDELCEILDIA